MDRTEIERIANTVVLDHLTADVEFGAVHERDDCYDIPERDLNAIHDRVHEVLKRVAGNLRTEIGDTNG